MRFIAALPLLAALSATAAQVPPAQNDPEILKTVERMFDAMRARDTIAFKALLDSNARLVGTGERSGQPYMRVTPISQFIQSVGTSGRHLDEKIFDAVVQRHQNLATVWVRYEFLLDGQFSHCGYDAFMLFKSAQGWKIFEIADTRLTTGCPGR